MDNTEGVYILAHQSHHVYKVVVLMQSRSVQQATEIAGLYFSL